MAAVRKRHTTEFKVKVAVEAIRQQKTANELTKEYGIHATQITIKSIHRAVTTGFSNALKVPCRSCFSCAKCKVGDVLNCENGAADKSNNKPWLDGETSRELKAVVIEAKSDQVCQYTSGPAIDVAKAVFESCEPDHSLVSLPTPPSRSIPLPC